MTLDQLAAFLAVAEREHLTRAAVALNLSPSAVSAAIKALEASYGVALFDRVGRGIVLSGAGRLFLKEARETLARARLAEQVLKDLGGSRRGVLEIQASQTIANHWLPQRLVGFRASHPGVELHLRSGNTAGVVEAVIEGAAELGFVEAAVDEPALASAVVARDRLAVVVPAGHAAARRTGRLDADGILALSWIVREEGSGTRAVFEAGLRALGIDPRRLDIVLTLPSNEAVLAAVRATPCAAALSRTVAAPLLESGDLAELDVPLEPRAFLMLHHRERTLSAAARAFQVCCTGGAQGG